MSRKPKTASRPTRRELDLTKAEIVKINEKLQACTKQHAKDAEQISHLTAELKAANEQIAYEQRRVAALTAERNAKSERISDLRQIITERDDTIGRMAQIQGELHGRLLNTQDDLRDQRRYSDRQRQEGRSASGHFTVDATNSAFISSAKLDEVTLKGVTRCEPPAGAAI